MMDEQQEKYFNALNASAKKDADALESPRLKGFKKSIVEKYSDQAHFIYELLQNADDAKATSARFELFNDRLVFAHNGTRRFSVSNPDTEENDCKCGMLGDINAIVSVGNSNKNKEATIGKFGVGFKAVFQYTATPHIYDPDVFFKIERFIVPIRLKEDYPGRQDGETLFVFPFNNIKCSPEKSQNDISEKLRSLNYPLLFLPNLKEIHFNAPNICGSYEREIIEKHDFNGTTAECIKLIQNNGTDWEKPNENCLWLFSREDENMHKYSVGFFIDKEGHLIPQKHYAFCFFPTKVFTKLNFIIHAPFLLTDSRESIIAGVKHNIDMIDLLSKLAADSLVFLKDIGQSKSILLIDDNIFDIVPYDAAPFEDADNKNDISFKPFYTAIKEAFETQAIIPSLEHEYVCSSNAYWGGSDNSQLAKVFSNNQLQSLTKNKNAKWAFPSLSTPTNYGRNVKFDYIREVIQNVVTENTLINCLNNDFIETQRIEWLHTLYNYISSNKERKRRIKTKPIFLDSEGKAVAAYDTNEQAILFLPSYEGSDYTTVNEELLQNEDTYKFIKEIGICEPSQRDEIYNIILPQYRNGTVSDTRPHFMMFFRYYQTCSQAEATSFLNLIKEYDFVLYTSLDDENQYCSKANVLYFPWDSLTKWFSTKPQTKFVSYFEYLRLVGEDNNEALISFLSELGVKKVPRVISRQLSYEEARQLQRFWERSTRDQTWTVNEIDGCAELIDSIIANQNSELSFFLWSQLLELVRIGYLRESSYWSPENILLGRYQYFFRNTQFSTFESREAKRLRTKPWLCNSNEEFVSADELTVQNLNKQYDISSDEAHELCRILGIKTEVDESVEEDVDITYLGEQLGLSEEEQRQALREFAMRKQAEASTDNTEFDDDGYDDSEQDCEEYKNEDSPIINRPSIKRVLKEITERATTASKERFLKKKDDVVKDIQTDEDDYTKQAVDINKKIEVIKEKAERDIQEIARLEDLRQQAQRANTYSFGWFKALLELESINSGENNANSREISISFAKVELEADTTRTLILKHPNRYIPQSMEDLADIPLELHFSGQPMVKVAVEVVNVKSYTLKAKLRTNAQIDGIDLSQVVEAHIEARNPVFLIEELRKAFVELGKNNAYDDDFDMQGNLCENIEFIFGPPGTGKTTYVAEKIILPMMRSKQALKVLVLTPTNKSADVLVRRLMQSMGSDRSYLNWLVRFGATSDNIIEQSGVFRDKTFDIRTFPRNVTVTTIARFPYDYFLPDEGTRLHLSALMWDYIIIDEASMIPLSNIVYLLYKKTPEKFIIAGDPFQIEPITSVDTWKGENIYTMVELTSFTDPKTKPHNYKIKLLTTQYRSIPEIGEVFSRFAYGGVLKHYRTAHSQRSLSVEEIIDLKPINIIKFPVSKYESIYRPKRLQGKTPYQVYSALFAFEFAKYLASLISLSMGNEKFRIGLIAPYRAQADLIDKLMSSYVFPKNIDVQVGTIHGFQGDECDIIIALFNPPPKISTHPDMFLNKLNIINVSISRAKDYLIILMPDDKTENIDDLILIKKVERLCKEQPMCNEQLSSSIEEMMFGSKTYLDDNSFSTTHQLVNVYGKPEMRYEVRSEDNAVDVQIYENK